MHPDDCPACGFPLGDCQCDDEWGYETPPDDSGEWECQFPGECLMPDPIHHRSECYTVEDAEAQAEQEAEYESAE